MTKLARFPVWEREEFVWVTTISFQHAQRVHDFGNASSVLFVVRGYRLALGFCTSTGLVRF